MSNNATDNTARSARVITIRLRIPALIISILLIIFGFIWTFILGIMLGRGQVNDQLSRILPGNNGTRVEAQNDATDRAVADIEELIKAEDLQFKESLGQQPEGLSLADDSARVTQTSSTPAAPAVPAPQASAPGTPAPRPGMPGAVAQPRNLSTSAASAQVYQYLYQVASYKKREQAAELVSRLGAYSIDAQIENTVIQNEPWHRVLISFQGNEAELAGIREILKNNFKINSMLQRGKKQL